MAAMKPSIGRVIWYYPPGYEKGRQQPWPASVCFIHEDNCVNVGGFNANGSPFSDTRVLLHNDPQSYGHPGGSAWAEWMPYQHEAQAKADAKATS